MVESAAVGNVGVGMGVSHSEWVTAAAGVKAGSRDSSSFVRKNAFQRFKHQRNMKLANTV